jgi:hypothetical protein
MKRTSRPLHPAMLSRLPHKSNFQPVVHFLSHYTNMMWIFSYKREAICLQIKVETFKGLLKIFLLNFPPQCAPAS